MATINWMHFYKEKRKKQEIARCFQSELPLHRVWYVHVSAVTGGVSCEGTRIDNLVCSRAVFLFFLGAIKGSLPKGVSAHEVHCCSVLPNAMVLAILFNLYVRPLGDIIRHHSILSLAPK